MEPLIIECVVKFDNKKSLGMAIFTPDTFYFFQKPMTDLATAGAVGGLLGALLGAWLNKRRQAKNPTTFWDDPEWNRFDEKTRKRIKQMVSMKKLSAESIIRTAPTKVGIQFFTSANEEVSFQGWVHKKKVLAWLSQNGFSVPNV